MVDSHGPWATDGFPDVDTWRTTGTFPGEVCDLITAWIATLTVDPQRSGEQVSVDGNLWSSAVPGAYYIDEAAGMMQVMCDYRIHEGEHRVEFVELGVITTASVTEVDRFDGMG